MSQWFRGTRLIFSLSFALFGAAVFLGIWQQPISVQGLIVALLSMVWVATLVQKHAWLSLGVLMIAVAMYSAAMLFGENPLGTWVDALKGGALLAAAWGAAWLLSRYVSAIQSAFAEQNAMIESLSSNDPETGSLRMSHFRAMLDYEIERSRRYRHPLAIAAIRVIDAPELSRQNGGPAADEQARLFVELIMKTIRALDRVGRSRANEYLLMLPQTDYEHAQNLADRLVRLASDQFAMAIVIGISAFPDDGTNSEALLGEANAALEFARMNNMTVVTRKVLES
ncbi:MAG: diguanylate cyclase [Acidobacteria bacterium]|nr:diguanylate cyclase [Acidobacteriota bacterium]